MAEALTGFRPLVSFLKTNQLAAGVVELADAPDSKSGEA